MVTPYDTNLDRNAANFQPLTPLSFLARAAAVYPEQTAIIHGKRTWSYREFFARAKQLASALAKRGIKRGDTVAAVLANTPAMLEAHYGVAMSGAVLNTINTRLDAAIIAFTLDHGEAKVLITDREFSTVVKDALTTCKAKPLVIDYDDPEFTGAGERLSNLEYEDFLRQGDPDFAWLMPNDEWDAISLNYTSGTTGDPKGVVYHHRGAYLLAMANVITCAMAKHPVYLWTLPMFHCNGWCFPWTLSVVAGTHVCLRAVRAAPIFDAIATHKVTHLCGAPIVMSTLLNAPEDEREPLPHVVEFITAAAPPPESVLAAMKASGFNVTHVYGLTETYGPASVNDWHREWDALPGSEQAAKKARQGVSYPVLDALDVRSVTEYWCIETPSTRTIPSSFNTAPARVNRASPASGLPVDPNADGRFDALNGNEIHGVGKLAPTVPASLRYIMRFEYTIDSVPSWLNAPLYSSEAVQASLRRSHFPLP